MNKIIIFLLFIISSTSINSQDLISINCPIDSMKVDSLIIINKKLNKILNKRVKKYSPERKIAILTLDSSSVTSIFYSKKKLGILLKNNLDGGYTSLIYEKLIFGYFVIDDVLFIVDIHFENLLNELFLRTSESKLIYSEEGLCNFFSNGQLSDFECFILVNIQNNKQKIRVEDKKVAKFKGFLNYHFQH